MKLATNNGRFLIFSENEGIALYYEIQKYFSDSEEIQNERKKITRIIKNGKTEWEWALKNWGQEPQVLSCDETSLLNFASRKLSGVETFAIKNSKGYSVVLGQSNFFLAPQAGYLIVCGSGSTSRRVHQGGNSWDLFNFQRVEQVQEKVAGTLCDFGTYGGSENHFGGITIEELVPLTQLEWERIRGAEFSNQREFSWFKSTVNEQPQLRGLHREGNYVLRTPFRSHNEIGEFAVYPDIKQYDHWSWEKLTSGYENPLPVKKVGVEILGCQNLLVAEDNTSDGIRKIYFAEFQFFNFPSFWVGYETITETEADAITGIKAKATSYMLGNLNYKLRRNNGVDSKRVLNFFKAQGYFVGTPADSYAVGNCAIGTYDWMRKIFNVPESNSVRWNNFPVYVYKEFRIPFKTMEQLFENDYQFRKVVEYVYLKKNPISGELTTETASQLLFNPIEESIGKIITKYEARKFLNISEEIILLSPCLFVR